MIKQEITATPEYLQAINKNEDRWVPACGGHETPFDYNGTRYLYVFNPHTHEHSYINLDTDMIEAKPPFVK